MQVVIVDHVDVISMQVKHMIHVSKFCFLVLLILDVTIEFLLKILQNWVHVNTVFEHLNRTPLKQHGTDMMRIRPW